VVAGKTHNPTILNPDFLTLQRIVPEDWKVAQTITTPPFSMVRYENGISLVVEMEKLQVVDLATDREPGSSHALKVASEYVKTLPHVHYTALGINFQSVTEVPQPETALKERFLKEGAWDSPAHRVSAAGVRLIYPLPSGQIALSFDAGTAQGEETDGEATRTVIITNGNFHRECEGYPSNGQVLDHLDHVVEDWSVYQTLLHHALSEEK
jgi:hypothetical protein